MSFLKPKEPENSIKILMVYADADQELRDQLERHLGALTHAQKIMIWQDRELGAGKRNTGTRQTYLAQADMILLLISSDFLASKYCQNIAAVALERYRAGTTRVIPVLLRSVLWQHTPLGGLQALPTGARPIKLWPDIDEAFADVARGIKTVVEELQQEGHGQEPIHPAPAPQDIVSPQLYYTFCYSISGRYPGMGFGIRAHSLGLDPFESRLVRELDRYLHYQLPDGADPLVFFEHAPISLVLAMSIHAHHDSPSRFFLRKQYLGLDRRGRPGNYFTHAIIDPRMVSAQTEATEPLSAHAAISLWEAPFWKTSADHLAASETILPGVMPEELSRYSDVQPDFNLYERQMVTDWLPKIFAAFLLLNKHNKKHLYLAAPSEIVAIFIWCITRCLPRTLICMQNLTFSTYEYNVSHASMDIVGTCWLQPDTRRGIFISQSDPLHSYYQDRPDSQVIAINCYNQKHTPFEIDKVVQHFTTFATKSLLEGEMTLLDTLLTQAEARKHRTIDEFLAFFDSQTTFLRGETPTENLVQQILAQPALWSYLLHLPLREKLMDGIRNLQQGSSWQRWWQAQGKIQLQQMRQCILEQPDSKEAEALSALANQALQEGEKAMARTFEEKSRLAFTWTALVPFIVLLFWILLMIALLLFHAHLAFILLCFLLGLGIEALLLIHHARSRFLAPDHKSVITRKTTDSEKKYP